MLLLALSLVLDVTVKVWLVLWRDISLVDIVIVRLDSDIQEIVERLGENVSVSV